MVLVVGDYADFPIKFKRPRLSCIRDFPNGCGRSTRPEVLVSVKNEENLVVDEKGVVDVLEEAKPVQHCEDVMECRMSGGNEVNLAVDEKGVVDVLEEDKHVRHFEDMIECRSVEVFDHLELGSNSVDLDSRMMEEDVVSSHDDDDELVSKIKPLDDGGLEVTTLSKEAIVGTFPKIYPPRRRISATRDFPSFCGSTTQCCSHEVDLIRIDFNDLDNEMINNVEHNSPCRRISATRHFPPSCGSTAQCYGYKVSPISIAFPSLDHETIDNVEEFEEAMKIDVKQVKEEAQSGNASDSEKSGLQIQAWCGVDDARLHEMDKDFVNDTKNCTNQVEREKSTSLQEGGSVVQALMAASKCPLKNRKREFGNAVKNDVKQVKDEAHSGRHSSDSEKSGFKIQARIGADGTLLEKQSEINTGREVIWKGDSVKPNCDTNLSQSFRVSQNVIQKNVEEFEEAMKIDVKQVKEEAQSGNASDSEKSGLQIQAWCGVDEARLHEMDKDFVNDTKNCTNQVEREKSTSLQVGGSVVQALMAASKCPLKNRKREFGNAVKNDVKQVKDEAHSGRHSSDSEKSGFKIHARIGADGTLLEKPPEINTEREVIWKGDSVKPNCDTNLSQSFHISQNVIQKNKEDVVGCSKGEMKKLLNQVESDKPISSQQVRAVVVQALMAAPNCPWEQKKKVSKTKSTSGAIISK